MPKFTIMDSVLTPDGKLGRVGMFDTDGQGRSMAKVNFGNGDFGWYEVSKLTHSI